MAEGRSRSPIRVDSCFACLTASGIAPLESVTAACLQESDVEALLDHGVIRLRGPEGSELPMVEPTTVEDLAAAAEEQEVG